MALYLGLPPPIQGPQDLTVVSQLTDKLSLPHNFIEQLEIHRKVAHHLSVVSAGNDPINLSVMRLFVEELNAMGASSEQNLGPWAQISILRAKLSLYTLICMESDGNDTATPSIQSTNVEYHFRINRILVQKAGLHVARSLLRTTTQVIDEIAQETNFPKRGTDRFPPPGCSADESGPRPAIAMPKHHKIAASFAAFFLIKHCMFNPDLSHSERALAEDAVKNTCTTFMRVATHALDEAARTAEVLQVLCHAGGYEQRMSDRQCASLIYDAARSAAELRGKLAETSPEVVQYTASPHSKGDGRGTSENGVTTGVSMAEQEVHWEENLDSWFSLPEVPNENWPFGDFDMICDPSEGLEQMATYKTYL